MSTTPSYISSMFAKVASTAQESPISPLPGQEDQSARLAASAEVGQVEGTIYRPIGEYVSWLFAELARLDGTPSSPDCLSYQDCQAALRVYTRFVNHRLGRS